MKRCDGVQWGGGEEVSLMDTTPPTETETLLMLTQSGHANQPLRFSSSWKLPDLKEEKKPPTIAQGSVAVYICQSKGEST